ncbi:MAG: hypothetical protein SFY66_05145 [Oculatellaceae cyanobacterium bins.114]|nr:hypothetical protein [Oculatellaceae cyanobacterium bins.114]
MTLLQSPSMQPPDASQLVIKYNILPREDGVILCLWEPAPMDGTRVKPFLYMVRQRFPSEDEAKKLLDFYLTTYQTAQAVCQ